MNTLPGNQEDETEAPVVQVTARAVLEPQAFLFSVTNVIHK